MVRINIGYNLDSNKLLLVQLHIKDVMSDHRFLASSLLHIENLFQEHFLRLAVYHCQAASISCYKFSTTVNIVFI